MEEPTKRAVCHRFPSPGVHLELRLIHEKSYNHMNHMKRNSFMGLCVGQSYTNHMNHMKYVARPCSPNAAQRSNNQEK